MEEQTFVGTTLEESENEPKDKKVWVIVAVVLVVLCCCCVVAGAAGVYLWNNGDKIFGLASNFVPNLI